MSHDCSCHGADGRLATTVTGLIERPLYAPGLILQDSDLTAAVDYTRDLNRLLFRTLFGCGVLCGLGVSIREDCGLTVTVAPGVALDGCGDPLHLPGPASLKLEERDGVLSPVGTTEAPRHTEFWVVACGKERRCAPRSLVCDDSLDDIREATRARGATEISVTFDPPECACAFDGDALKTDAASRDILASRLMRAIDPNGAATPASAAKDAGGTKNVDQPPIDSNGRISHITAHDSPDCPPDCGCGSACDCGCCVLLAWARWDDKNGWVVLHKGVRRFVRPQLIADPIDEQFTLRS
ncbi:hypothetical protein [Sphingomonas bacterium]|uniref:hypothetical protein n=1 Tax=Sphingomonas bacterium TaxID=1895847 RepID=UPI0026155F63|nr:hypothetical protein [Sphingomonas bacterium]MDB5678535.1 hypothetical protein [Sphingomonas bacterium]